METCGSSAVPTLMVRQGAVFRNPSRFRQMAPSWRLEHLVMTVMAGIVDKSACLNGMEASGSSADSSLMVRQRAIDRDSPSRFRQMAPSWRLEQLVMMAMATAVDTSVCINGMEACGSSAVPTLMAKQRAINLDPLSRFRQMAASW